MLAYCGVKCDTCPIFMATKESDRSKKQSMREMIAKIFFEQYNLKLLPEEVSDCDGCRSTIDHIFPGCNNCEVRKCIRMKNIESCAYCEDFACAKLNKMFGLEPTSKIRLEEIRNANQPLQN